MKRQRCVFLLARAAAIACLLSSVFISPSAAQEPQASDRITIARSWPMFERRGNAYSPGDTSGPINGRVTKGMTARKLLLHGCWYEIELEDGKKGWVPLHAVAPQASEATTVKHAWTARADTSRVRKTSKRDFQIDAGTALTQVERGIGWVKVRTKDGREGWLESYKLEIEGALPVDATSAFWYRTFDSIDRAGAKSSILGVLVFLFQWLVLPMFPGMAVFFLLYFSAGPLPFINNWFLKTGYGVLAFFIGSWFILSFIPSVPPFMGGFTGGIMQFWAFAMLVGVIIGVHRRISYDRCNNCRRINAGRIDGSAGGNTEKVIDTTKTTYGYANGHTRTETKETTTTSHTTWVRVKCRFCGHTWLVQETSSSRKTAIK
ncbi:MAG: SH3 domain-containing protein [Acidobacteriota bacterium]